MLTAIATIVEQHPMASDTILSDPNLYNIQNWIRHNCSKEHHTAGMETCKRLYTLMAIQATGIRDKYTSNSIEENIPIIAEIANANSIDTGQWYYCNDNWQYIAYHLVTRGRPIERRDTINDIFDQELKLEN